ncbi:hypothetical protein, partial [Rhizobium sp.]|uniref:hypothetical protein n=1 Tax=Rhizobium sp. TaxID=391 RepID=UPI0028AAFA66
ATAMVTAATVVTAATAVVTATAMVTAATVVTAATAGVVTSAATAGITRSVAAARIRRPAAWIARSYNIVVAVVVFINAGNGSSRPTERSLKSSGPYEFTSLQTRLRGSQCRTGQQDCNTREHSCYLTAHGFSSLIGSYNCIL